MTIYLFHFNRACQNGHIEQVDCLISAGAKCKAHKSSKCTPLYAAIRGGHLSIVRKLLVNFPEVIKVSAISIYNLTSIYHLRIFNSTALFFSKDMTSENWSPLHVACINGKNDVVDLLLEFPFEKKHLQKYR